MIVICCHFDLLIVINFVCSGITLSDGTAGFASIGTMCGRSSGGLTNDGGSSVARVASTAAHELGHTLNMLHDDNR